MAACEPPTPRRLRSATKPWVTDESSGVLDAINKQNSASGGLMQVIQGELLAMSNLFETLGEDVAEDLKNVVTCEYCRTGCAPCRKPVPPDSSQPVSLG